MRFLRRLADDRVPGLIAVTGVALAAIFGMFMFLDAWVVSGMPLTAADLFMPIFGVLAGGSAVVILFAAAKGFRNVFAPVPVPVPVPINRRR